MDALPSMLSFAERGHCNLKRDYPLQFRRDVSGMLPQHGVQKDHALWNANGQLTDQTLQRLLKPCLASVELQDRRYKGLQLRPQWSYRAGSRPFSFFLSILLTGGSRDDLWSSFVSRFGT